MSLATVLPLQARSRRTFEAILDATEQLLKRQRFEDIGVSAIVRASEVSTGSFYARFASKEALLPILYSRYEEQIVARGTAIVLNIRRARGLDEACLIFVRSIAAIFRDNINLMRAVTELARKQPDATMPVSDRRRQLHHDLETAMLLNAGGPAETALDSIRAAQFMTVCTLREAILYPNAPFAALAAPDQIEKTVARMFASYIRGNVE